jgi:hypothetical protein
MQTHASVGPIARAFVRRSDSRLALDHSYSEPPCRRPLVRRAVVAVAAMTKGSMKLFLPWSAVFMVSRTLANAINVGIVGASMNSSPRAQTIVIVPTVASRALLDGAQPDVPGRCLSAWSFVSAEGPEIYAARFEQFVDSGYIAP